MTYFLVKKGTSKSIPSQWNRFESTPLEKLVPCLEFTIEIESNSLMYNPNKEIKKKFSLSRLVSSQSNTILLKNFSSRINF